MNTLLFDICKSDDPWEAFTTRMPEQHKNRFYCKAFHDALYQSKDSIAWDTFDSYPMYYKVCHLLFSYGAISAAEFIECCKLLTADERAEYAFNSLYTNYSDVSICILISMYPNFPLDKMMLKDDRLYRLILDIALKNRNLELFTQIVDKKYCMMNIIPVLRNYNDLIPEALNILSVRDKDLNKQLNKWCSYSSLKVFIPHICKLRNITIKDYFVERVNDFHSFEYIECFIKAGFTRDEIVEINGQINSEFVRKWLDK